jgi:AmiR/NasT family two-component response regulator
MERHKMKTIDTIYDVVTGETTDIERDLTAEEIAKIEENAKIAETEAKAAKEIAKAKAALLEKLGITEDEAKLLLG